MKDSETANVHLLHHVPRRIRMRVLSVKGHPRAAASALKSVLRSSGIRSVRACELTGSVVVEYDSAHTDSRALVNLLDARSRLTPRKDQQCCTPQSARTPRFSEMHLRCGSRAATGPLGNQIGSWFLGKTVEIAVERSLMLFLAAVL